MSDITSIRGLLIETGRTTGREGLQSDIAKGFQAWTRDFEDLQVWQKLDKNYRG